jgi:hypothetical protein
MMMPRAARAAAVLMALGCAGQSYAQSSNLTAVMTVTPNPVAPGGLLTVTLTVTNQGSQDASDVIVGINDVTSEEFVEARTPSGLSIAHYDDCFLTDCSRPFTGVRGPIRTGASVVLSVIVRILSTPGATVQTRGVAAVPFSSFCCWSITSRAATTTVAGSGPPPSAPSRLAYEGVAAPQFLPLVATDVVLDPVHRVHVVAGHGPPGESSRNAVAVLDLNGLKAGDVRDISAPGDNSFVGPTRMSYSADLGSASSAGGVMLTWSSQTAGVYTRAVLASGGLTDAVRLGAGDSPRIAYSPINREFLVVWLGSAPQVVARRVDLQGQPIGPVIEIASDDLPYSISNVVWNPVTNQFGVAYLRHSGLFPTRLGTLQLARLAANGALLSRTLLARASSIDDPRLAVNSRTGEYVVLWHDTDTFGAEVNPSGHVVSRGLIASRSELVHVDDLAFNAVSGTFLVLGRRIPDNSFKLQTGMLELNQYGAPLSTSIPTEADSGVLISSHVDTAQWRIVDTRGLGYSFDPLRLESQAIRTVSPVGGSTARLGGCITPDPFVFFGGGACYAGAWLPPGITAPGTSAPVNAGGCVTGDPFVAFGGGTCANGGWYPPGMLSPAPTPTPTGCVTPDPFVALGGGTCANGGWYPPGEVSASTGAVNNRGRTEPRVNSGGSEALAP